MGQPHTRDSARRWACTEPGPTPIPPTPLPQMAAPPAPEADSRPPAPQPAASRFSRVGARLLAPANRSSASTRALGDITADPDDPPAGGGRSRTPQIRHPSIRPGRGKRRTPVAETEPADDPSQQPGQRQPCATRAGDAAPADLRPGHRPGALARRPGPGQRPRRPRLVHRTRRRHTVADAHRRRRPACGRCHAARRHRRLHLPAAARAHRPTGPGRLRRVRGRLGRRFFWAATPRQAAEQAWRTMRRPGSQACVFQVVNRRTGRRVEIDLLDEEPDPAPAAASDAPGTRP